MDYNSKIFEISYVTFCNEWRIKERFDLPDYSEINKVRKISCYGYEVFVSSLRYSIAITVGQRLIEDYIESKNSSGCLIDLDDKIYEVGYQLVDKQWKVEEIPDIPARHFSNQAYITYWGYQTYIHADSYVQALESGSKIINHEIETRKRVDRGQMKFAVVRLTHRVDNGNILLVHDIGVDYISYSESDGMRFISSRKDSSMYWVCKIPTEDEQNKK
jgi:hypothetical protein